MGLVHLDKDRAGQVDGEASSQICQLFATASLPTMWGHSLYGELAGKAVPIVDIVSKVHLQASRTSRMLGIIPFPVLLLQPA
jgi:hypothetical protein